MKTRFALLFALVAPVAGCAVVKQVARTVNDAASILCEDAAGQMMGTPDGDRVLQGLSAADWCKVHDNLAPFVEAALRAQQTAATQAGLKGESKSVDELSK